MLCEEGQGTSMQEGLALRSRPVRQYDRSGSCRQQRYAQAARHRNMQRSLFPFTHDTFNNPHSLLLNLPQANCLACTGCQAAHGRQSKVAQTCPLDVGLGELIDARTQDKTVLLCLLNYAIALQGFEQSV